MRRYGRTLRGRAFLVSAGVAAAALALALTGARAATIQTDLWAYQVGDTVTVTGEGFAAGEDVGFVAYDPFGAVADLGQAAADDQGGVEYQFVLQDDTPGIYTEVATGQTSGLTASTAFDPAPSKPGTLSFGDARWAGDGVTLSWSQAATGTTADCFYVYRTSATTPAGNPGNPTVPNVGNSPSCSVLPTGAYAIASGPTFTDTLVDQTHNYRYGVTGVKASTNGNGGQGPISNLVTVGMLNATVPSAFPQTTVGSAAAAQTVTVTNNSGGTITYHGIETSAEFPVSNVKRSDNTTMVADSTTVANGQSFSFSVGFQPSAGGARSTTLKIEGFDGNQGTTTFDTHSITVTGTGNSTPTCSAVSKTTNEDTAGSVALSCTDADAGDTLNYAHSSPAHGSLSGTGASLTYTPSANYNGSDSFTYTATDNHGAVSNTATVTLTVSPVNDAPTTSSGSATTDEDTSKSIELKPLVSDIETSPASMTYTIVAAPTKGTLTQTSTGVYSYTPAANVNGSDSFTYKVTDTGDGASPPQTSGTATVSLTINPVNDAPSAPNGSAATNEDTAKTVDLTAVASDVETASANLTYSITGAPAHGTLTATGPGVYTYTPLADYNGSDTFTYTVTDTGDGASPPLTSSAGTFTLTVNPVNDAPSASAGSVATNEDTAGAIDLKTLTSDVETPAGALAYAVVSGPAHGGVSLAGGVATYAPAANYSGGDSFTYRVTDGGDGASAALSRDATVTITVAPVNDAPSFGPIADVSFDEGHSASVDLGAAFGDVETPAASATFGVVSAPAGLTATISGTTLSLAAADNLSGDVTVRATDTGDGADPALSAQTTFHVTVNNVAPTASSLTGATPIQEFNAGSGSPQVDGRITYAPGNLGNGAFHAALTHSVPAGKTLVVAVGITSPDDAQQVTSMTDSQGNAYSYVNGFAPGTVAPVGSHSYALSLYTTYVTQPLSAGDVISGIANTTTFSAYDVEVWQLSGIAPNGVESSSANDPHQNPLGTVDALPITTTDAPTLLFAEHFSQNIASFTATGGYSSAGQSDDPAWNKSLFAMWKAASSPGTFTASAITVPPMTTLNVFVAFRAATGAAPGPGVSTVSFQNVVDASSTDAGSLHFAFDCNGGDLSSATYATAGTSPAADCTFDNAGDYVVTGRVLDKDGGVSQLYSFTVHVSDVAPTATLSNSGPIDEGGSATISFAQQLDGSADTAAGFHYAYACDGGSLAAATYASSGTSASASCSFDDGPASRTVRARIIDQHDGYTEYTTTVAVRNVAPTATLQAPDTVFLGNSFTLALTGATDPSSADTAAGFTGAFDCGSGFGTTATCTPTATGDVNVRASIADKDGGTSTYGQVVHVTVPAPTAALSATDSVNEGSSIHLSLDGAHSDSPTAQAAGFTYAFDCGDGAGYRPASTANSVDCPAVDNALLTIRATVFDAFGNATEYLQNVNVVNVRPSVTAPAGQAASEGSASLFSLGSFADPGTLDAPWHVSLDWGDGSGDSFDAGGPGSLGLLTHTYADNGTYTVGEIVTDKDGESGTATFTVTVANVAPTADLANDGPVAEGSPVHLTFSNVFDSSPVDAAALTLSYACDGSTFQSEPTCTFDDNGVYHVVGRVADKDGGVTDYTTDVTVTNVAPVADFAAIGEINEGSPTTLTFSNAFDPSSADTAAGLTYAYACDGSNFGAAVDSSTATCAFPTPGIYTVAGEVVDKDGALTPYQAQVVVDNVAPALSAAAAQSSDEGSATVFDLGSFTDPGSNDGPWTVDVDWGDGNSSSFTAATRGALSRGHTYDDNGSYSVSVTVTDKLGLADSAGFHVAVANVAPTADFAASSPIGEGSATTLTLTNQTDPSSIDAAALAESYSCNGVDFTSTSSCTFTDNGSYTVYGRIRDKDGGASTYHAQVVVTDVAPTLAAAANQSGLEGSDPIWTLGSFSDPGTADAPWTVSVAWGDGSSSSFTTGAPGAIAADHAFANNGLYTVSVTVADKDGAVSAAQSFRVAIANVPPAVTAPLDQLATEGTAHTFALGSFSDPGSLDGPWHVDVAWGDGTDTTFSPATTGLLTAAAHTYADNGSYTATISVTDHDGTTGTGIFHVTVANATPGVAAPSAQSAAEGTSTLLPLGSFSDLGANDHPWSVDVNWGDGTSHATFTTASQGSLGTMTHTYPDNGAYTVAVGVTDKDGALGTASYNVVVTNVAPAASLAQVGTANEGGSATIAFSGQFDPSSADTIAGFSYRYDCGSGYGSTTNSASGSCPFPNSGIYTVHGQISDKDGGTSTYAATVTVANVAPAATISNNGPINEGGSARVTLSGATDVSPADRAAGFTYAFACNGSTFVASATSYADCSFDDNGSYVVLGRITDQDGGSNAYPTTVVVNNVAPTATFADDGPAVEGGAVHLAFSNPVDPSHADTAAGFTYTYACAGVASAIPSCTFADNGSYTVAGTITDKNGGATTYTHTVTVANAIPVLTAGSNQSADEGTTKTFSLGSFGDAGVNDAPWTVAVSWGDGNSSTFTTSSLGAVSYAHTYADNGSYTVSTTVTDKDHATSAAGTFTVTVANVAPALTAAAGQSANEGAGVVFDLGSFNDPGASDNPWTVDVNWGDPTAHTSFTTATRGALGTRSHTYDDNGSYTVTVTVTDKDGGSSSSAFTVTVANVNPTATLAAPDVNEGSPIAISLTSPADASNADRAAGFTYAFDCGSGYGSFGAATTASCPTTDNGTRNVGAKIRDKDGGVSTYTRSVTIANVAPTVTTTDQTANEGAATSLPLGSFGDPGPDSPWTVDVDWGDGSAHYTATVTSTGTLGSQSHTYADNGSYTVTVKVTDKDGGVGTKSFTVAVADVPPTAIFPLTASGYINAPISLAFTGVTDPAAPDTAAGFHYAYDCNNGSLATVTYATATAGASFTCTYASVGTYTVRARVYDKDNGYSEFQSTVGVTNPPATAAFAATGNTTSINEGTTAGTSYIYTGTITFGDAATTVAADCGTGNPIVTGSLTYTVDGGGNRNGFSFRCVFVYTTPTTYTLHATASRGSATGPTATLTVTIANVAPTVTITSPLNFTSYLVGSPVNFVATFRDAGASDGPWTCQWAFGNGVTRTVTPAGTAQPYSCNTSYQYPAKGTFTATLTVTDKYGAVGQKTVTVIVS